MGWFLKHQSILRLLALHPRKNFLISRADDLLSLRCCSRRAHGGQLLPCNDVSGNCVWLGVSEAAEPPCYAETKWQPHRNPPRAVLAAAEAKTSHPPAQAEVMRRWTITCHEKTRLPTIGLVCPNFPLYASRNMRESSWSTSDSRHSRFTT